MKWICSKCGYDIKNNRTKHVLSCDGNGPRRKQPKKRSNKNWKIWNKGLTKENTESINAASIKIKKLWSDGKMTGHAVSEETKKKLSEHAKVNGYGGYIPGSGRGKKTKYESHIAGVVILDSSYELKYAEYLDNNKIKWRRNKDRFEYKWEGKLHYYTPDFYLFEDDLYVEIKGFKTSRDEAKWSVFPKKLKILFAKDLVVLGLDIKLSYRDKEESTEIGIGPVSKTGHR